MKTEQMKTSPKGHGSLPGSITEVALHANMCDQSTKAIADALHAPFELLGKDLSRNYGGTMDHLWIDFELIEAHAGPRPPRSFRFQKKVGGSIFKLKGLPTPVSENVGHYSVRPNFRALRNVPLDRKDILRKDRSDCLLNKRR